MVFGAKLLNSEIPLKAEARRTGIILWAFLDITILNHLIAIDTVIILNPLISSVQYRPSYRRRRRTVYYIYNKIM